MDIPDPVPQPALGAAPEAEVGAPGKKWYRRGRVWIPAVVVVVLVATAGIVLAAQPASCWRPSRHRVLAQTSSPPGPVRAPRQRFRARVPSVAAISPVTLAVSSSSSGPRV